MDKLFAVSAPGLEEFTAQELVSLGIIKGESNARKGSIASGLRIDKRMGNSNSMKPVAGHDEYVGGVEFEGNLEMIYRANLYLRTASRVLVRLGDFIAISFSELRKKASRLTWERYLRPGQAIHVRATCHKSRLYHSDAVVERVAGAIADRLGAPIVLPKSGVEAPAAQMVVVRIVHDHCTISIDSSGELLHRRGYRLATAKAPLRETLAAGMLMAAGWNGSAPLLDPFCGSGTIAIEGALMARGIAPGLKRNFAFMNWSGFDRGIWTRLMEENIRQAKDRMLAGQSPWIAASDRDAGAIDIAKANAERAGVNDAIEFSCRALSAIEPEGVGWIVTNPPYGLRTATNKDLRNLYSQLGKILRLKCRGWHVAILCNDLQLLRQIGLPLNTSASMVNGGILVNLARGEV